MSEVTYNGWKNYPTWAVNLWLSNDEFLYNETRERVGWAIGRAAAHCAVADGVWTAEQGRRFVLADDLKQWVTEELAPDLGATFAADLLGYAFGEVDWNEIAAAWLEEADDVCERASEYGCRVGTAAGSWVLDGNSSEETARALLEGIEDGDPMVLDSLPSSPLSGEWADSLTPADVLAELSMDEDDARADDVLSAFEDGYSRGVVDEVARSARAIIG